MVTVHVSRLSKKHFSDLLDHAEGLVHKQLEIPPIHATTLPPLLLVEPHLSHRTDVVSAVTVDVNVTAVTSYNFNQMVM
jgi:hypothetical protein